MLTQERFSIILDLLHKEKSVSAAQLIEATNSSPSTIRRDLSELEKLGRLRRVHGGAILKDSEFSNLEDKVENRREHNAPQKQSIGKKAAALIAPGDFVYVDAGTTTEYLIDAVECPDVHFVTNAISHAKKLSERGYPVSLVAGDFKNVTEAIVGEAAVESVGRYNFTKGFFGTNGISEKGILNTPDSKEAAIKRAAMNQCEACYILADPSKFTIQTSVNFASLKGNTLITCQPAEMDSIPAGCEILYAPYKGKS